MRPRVLVCDNLAEAGIAILQEVADVVVADHRWSEEELAAGLGQFQGVVVRSQTRLTAKALAHPGELRVIARAGVGVDNIDLATATRHGIVVVNSPGGNTTAAAEHTIALLLAAARKIPEACQSVRRHEWKRQEFVGEQVYQKVLGVVGAGRVGGEVIKRAKGLGMKVMAHDPYITPQQASNLGVERVSLDELLMESDFVTLHAPSTDDTRGMMGAEQFALMKPSAILINCARGDLVDEAALAEALREGAIAGAALDVFSREPPESFELIDLPNVLATPHLGASTVEAQTQVAVDVSEQVVEVLAGRPARTPVNLPAFSAEVVQGLEPFLGLAERMGRLQAQLLQGGITRVELTYAGELAEQEVAPLRLYFLVGLLSPILSGAVNVVNAPVIAAQRGIEVVEAKNYVPQDYANLFSSAVQSEGGEMRVSGTVFGRGDARIVEVDRYRIDLVPSGLNLLVWHHDEPGIIGRVGTILGDNRINIAGMQVGRQRVGGEAVMALMVDQPIPAGVCREIEDSAGITRTVPVDLDGEKE